MASKVETKKIPGGRYRIVEADGTEKFVDCNGYSLDGNDKAKELAEKIAQLKNELAQLQPVEEPVKVDVPEAPVVSESVQAAPSLL